MKAACLVTLALAGPWAACSAPSAPKPLPGATRSALPAGIVATVGTLAVPEEAVVAVARAQHLSPRQAVDSEVHDAVFAAAALQRGFEDAPDVRAALRGRLARARLDLLKQQGADAAVTDAEVDEATARHFFELDRPEAFRVIHAVVVVPEKADPGAKARAKVLAERIAERVAPATDSADFKARVEAIDDRQGFEVRVESLKPVAADGRVIDADRPSTEERYTLSFARAAAHLTQPGQKSGVVLSEFGFHVMMLVERTVQHVVALEERRRLLHDEIVTERLKRNDKALIEQLRSASPPTIERAAETLLTTVIVDEHETR